MLCGKFKQILSVDTALTNNKQCRRFVTARFFTKRCVWINRWLANRSSIQVPVTMSPTLRFKFLLRGLGVSRLWSVWTRSLLVSSVVRRCRRERGVRDVLQCFRQTLLRPRHTLLLSATAAYKSAGSDDDGPPPCYNNITDEDMQALINDLVELEELARLTLYCEGCDKRVVIDKKVPGVVYCPCKESQQKMESPDGWVPYMEAEDVIIWRKEYKPGQGLYAYKVYGRYADVEARDFAAVQVDGAYRRAWDAAVAALAVVERDANGLRDQAVLHWEVLWPRLFANRDYVYIRRHKEFDARAACLAHKDGIFAGGRRACGAGGRGDAGGGGAAPAPGAGAGERPSVHSRAKRKAMELEQRERDAGREGEGGAPPDNKVFVIVSRSCVHPDVPETRRAIRVAEYWSHMVVQTLRGDGAPGMEFVLTYYDEPGVGGMPVGVAAWAAGRAAPTYLQRMRRAASEYRAWRSRHPQDTPDFTPFSPENVSQRGGAAGPRLREEDMESSRQGPEMDDEVSAPPGTPDAAVAPEAGVTPGAPDTPVAAEAPLAPGTPESPVATSDKSTQTVGEPPLPLPPPVPVAHPEPPRESPAPTSDANVQVNMDPPPQSEGEGDKPQEGESNGGWWRYLYPFYYFV